MVKRTIEITTQQTDRQYKNITLYSLQLILHPTSKVEKLSEKSRVVEQPISLQYFL